MKPFMILILTAGLCSSLPGQIEVGVWTDKPIYNYGDTVAVTVTAFNPQADTITLTFGSACQTSFVIDTFYLSRYMACAQIITSRVIPPHSAVRWDPMDYPCPCRVSPLPVGSHAVIGEVVEHGRSDTLLIFVTQPVTPVNGGSVPPGNFLLMQNYPNPFNGSTTIPFTVVKAGTIAITIYNNLGQKLRTVLNDYKDAGTYTVTANLNDFPSGLYWCRLESEGKSQTTRLILAK
ncbi:MAG TPA: T9SS type A sorting domain-containing protein [Bacteroidota bacterium]|nr:T9SS type A sorting domain-containing protein [Bacteroidota bacterium]